VIDVTPISLRLESLADDLRLRLLIRFASRRGILNLNRVRTSYFGDEMKLGVRAFVCWHFNLTFQ
jgi:hypothetical protein